MAKGKKIPALIVYLDKSVLINDKGEEEIFREGKTSEKSKERLAIIKTALNDGFLEKLVIECEKPDVSIENLSERDNELLTLLVNSVTSEVGRAIVGLTVLQLTTKALAPDQSIRLHKGSNAAEFSWEEGIPMRVLDKNFITPVLRKYELLRLNADGFMMTRSLAENYPYSKLYKAAIRGAKTEWTEIIDLIETGEMDAINALKQLLVNLHNNSTTFNILTEKAIAQLAKFISTNPDFDKCYDIICNFVDKSTYSARMFEVAMHAFFQALDSMKVLGGFLKPLSQMRSANKKHGNIGDIELTETEGNLDIIESWDAKYGKAYLRDELEELNDKLKLHPQATIVGFVTNENPNLKPEIVTRIKELELLNEIEIQVFNFKEWIDFNIEKYAVDANTIGVSWLVAICESICQRRREIAPIDEPTSEWVQTFIESIPVNP